MKGINRPTFPTRSDNPETQRLLASVNEVVTALLNSGVILSRVAPGRVAALKSATGVIGMVGLEWDTQNRIDVGVATGIALLPAIKPAFIGRPLYLTKLSPSGTIQVKPTGDALLNGFSGITKQAAGLSVLMNDGTNWSST